MRPASFFSDFNIQPQLAPACMHASSSIITPNHGDIEHQLPRTWRGRYTTVMTARRRRGDCAALHGRRRRSWFLSCCGCSYLLMILMSSSILSTSVVVSLSFYVQTYPVPTSSLRTSLQQQPLLRHHRRKYSTPSSLSSLFALEAVSQKRTYLFDGGELQSYFAHGITQNNNNSRNTNNNNLIVGCLTLVTGKTTNEDGAASSSPSRRVVGVQKLDVDNTESNDVDTSTISLDNNVHIYKHTVATIPNHISDNDALSTAAASLVGIHCALPNKVENVGGSALSDTDVFYSGRAVVLGGNDLACFLAE